jgi:hypothetical protein
MGVGQGEATHKKGGKTYDRSTNKAAMTTKANQN